MAVARFVSSGLLRGAYPGTTGQHTRDLDRLSVEEAAYWLLALSPRCGAAGW